ncbi:MAG TPA: S8 family serine peptidase [Blastocatellia bacterium]|nr:S8 family serine peptidase [Blastocatellia bacterium]
MNRLNLSSYLLALVLGCALTLSVSAATLSPTLQSKLNGIAADTNVGVVIVSFNTKTGLAENHLDILRGIGVTKGITLKTLGMVAFPATAAQVRALATNASITSIWSNDRLQYFDNQVRTVAGVERTRTDSTFTTMNGGLPVSGAGNFSVVINDSGIDATHDDLKLGRNVIQNVQIVTDTDTLTGFTPLLALENVPDTDLNVGHGTHCAGIVGGTGQLSGGLYAGVAPGAKLVGTGSGAVLFVLNALGGFEYSLANQFVYNVRVISNSFGSSGAFNPNNPLNLATRLAYERNIVVIFAAGNSGPGKDTYNPYAKAPWVIGVGAGTKEGGLAGFSSRGTPKEDRLANNDPNDDFDAPTIIAPGTGREFESNAAKFTAAHISTRSKSNLFSNGLTDDTELPVAFVPHYTQISGTSMATPFIAGTVALMLDADPTLTPDEIKQILTQTASRMPGYEEYQVGAGYVNAYAAVDKVFRRNKNYGSFTNPTFNAKFTVSGPTPEQFHVDYNPTALPGAGSTNARTFTVQPGMSVLDVFAKFDNALETGDGNTIGILLTAPNGTKYSSGITLPVLDSPSRQVIVQNPVSGQWLLEVRGVRGLAAVPNVSLPTSGAAVPGPVDITVKQQLFTLAPIADIQGHPAQAQIEMVLKNRMMDTYANGQFRPDYKITREDFARLLWLNTPVRQTLGATSRFTDVSGELAALAEAVTARGSNLRDFYTDGLSGVAIPEGLMSATGTTFNPNGNVKRIEIAVALIRALGLDAEAKAKAGSLVTVTYNGQVITLSDNADIPFALRGYVQFALDKGILQATFTLEQGPFDFTPTLKARVNPNDLMTRAFMAYALDNFKKRFVAGN